MNEVCRCVDCYECILVMMLIKKMVEDLIGYLFEYGFKVCYLYFEVDTFEWI